MSKISCYINMVESKWVPTLIQSIALYVRAYTTGLQQPRNNMFSFSQEVRSVETVSQCQGAIQFKRPTL